MPWYNNPQERGDGDPLSIQDDTSRLSQRVEAWKRIHTEQVHLDQCIQEVRETLPHGLAAGPLEAWTGWRSSGLDGLSDKGQTNI